MRDETLRRRDFGKMTVAAFGGLLAGCAASNEPGGQKANGEAAAEGDAPKVNVDPALLLVEPHVCRGLNTCKGKGKGGENACAGQGACASAKAHTCHYENECKGQGGCGGYPGQNTCKGKSLCAVPVSADTWKLARMQFEELMKAAGKKVGAAPKAEE
jgi:hypothetical protein